MISKKKQYIYIYIYMGSTSNVSCTLRSNVLVFAKTYLFFSYQNNVYTRYFVYIYIYMIYVCVFWRGSEWMGVKRELEGTLKVVVASLIFFFYHMYVARKHTRVYVGDNVKQGSNTSCACIQS